MPHEIDISTGTAAVFVTGTPAWHRLGRVIAEAATSADAIRLAGLDWHVEQWPCYACRPGTNTVRPTDRVANVRSDTQAVLGVVSRDYQPFQNAEAFAFMDQIIGDGLARYDTAGALKGGRQVWMLARLPNEVRVARGDVIEPYALLVNGHDGARALTVLPTTVRVVCQNTLNLALGQARQVLRIRHEGNVGQRVEEARQCLGVVVRRVEQFEDEVTMLAGRRLTSVEVTDYLQQLFPTGRPAS
jgi:phage/plasmid-like protein (TIGR03299 family)